MKIDLRKCKSGDKLISYVSIRTSSRSVFYIVYKNGPLGLLLMMPFVSRRKQLETDNISKIIPYEEREITKYDIFKMKKIKSCQSPFYK